MQRFCATPTGARDADVLGLVACRACAPDSRTPTPAAQAVGRTQQDRDSCGRHAGCRPFGSTVLPPREGHLRVRQPAQQASAYVSLGRRRGTRPAPERRHPARPSRRGAESLHGKAFGAMWVTMSTEVHGSQGNARCAGGRDGTFPRRRRARERTHPFSPRRGHSLGCRALQCAAARAREPLVFRLPNHLCAERSHSWGRGGGGGSRGLRETSTVTVFGPVPGTLLRVSPPSRRRRSPRAASGRAAGRSHARRRPARSSRRGGAAPRPRR